MEKSPPELVAALAADPAALRGWVGRAFAFTATLPSKEKKPPKATKAR